MQSKTNALKYRDFLTKRDYKWLIDEVRMWPSFYAWERLERTCTHVHTSILVLTKFKRISKRNLTREEHIPLLYLTSFKSFIKPSDKKVTDKTDLKLKHILVL